MPIDKKFKFNSCKKVIFFRRMKLMNLSHKFKIFKILLKNRMNRFNIQFKSKVNLLGNWLKNKKNVQN
jgi:hypothetical protein